MCSFQGIIVTEFFSIKGEWVTLQVCLKTLRVFSHWALSSEFIFCFSSVISQLEFSVV